VRRNHDKLQEWAGDGARGLGSDFRGERFKQQVTGIYHRATTGASSSQGGLQNHRLGTAPEPMFVPQPAMTTQPQFVQPMMQQPTIWQPIQETNLTPCSYATEKLIYTINIP
jgi:hypothetical protein